MAPELTLRIVIEQPPAGVDFGLQKGRGNAYETVQTQRRDLLLQGIVAFARLVEKRPAFRPGRRAASSSKASICCQRSLSIRGPFR